MPRKPTLSPAIVLVLFAFWTGCGGGSAPNTGGDGGPDAGGDAGPADSGPADGGPVDGGLDAGPVDAGPDAGTDAGADAGRDGGASCGPLDPYDGDAGGPNQQPNGAGCEQDLACPTGEFCYAGNRCVTPAQVMAYPGNGGRAADGGACEPTLALPQECEPSALAWSASQDVSRSPSGLVESDGALASDGHGTWVAAWSQVNRPPLTPEQINRLAVSHDDGLTFTVTAAPTDAASSAANDSQLLYDPAGRFLYLWEGYPDNFQGAQHIWLSTSTNGDQWSPAVQLDTPGDFVNGGMLDFPFMAQDPISGRLFVTYDATTVIGQVVERWVTVERDGGLSASAELDDGTRPSNYRDLAEGAFDSRGRYYVAWLEQTSNTVSTYFTRFDPLADGGWSRPPADVQVNSASEEVGGGAPQIAVVGAGAYVHVVYNTLIAPSQVAVDDSAFDLRSATSTDQGQSFAPSVKVNDDASCATHFKSSLALDEHGRLYLTWYDNRDGLGHFFYTTSLDHGTTYQPNRLVSAPVFPLTPTNTAPAGWAITPPWSSAARRSPHCGATAERAISPTSSSPRPRWASRPGGPDTHAPRLLPRLLTRRRHRKSHFSTTPAGSAYASETLRARPLADAAAAARS